MKHARKPIIWTAFLCLLAWILPLGTAGAEGALLPDMDGEAIERTIDAYVAENASTTAAVSIGVSRGGETLFQRAYGHADIQAQRAADADTVYEWGSATKLLVWTSVMQLVERGKLDLDADIRTYLPDGFFTRLTYDAPITMRNLMHHDAGWADVLVGLFVPPDSKIQGLEQTLRDSEPSQITAPGTVCAYSNWGVALAGLIVERISGETTFASYVHRNVFEPLGMARTALLPTLEDNDWVRQNRPLSEGYAGRTRIENRLAVPLYPAGMATGSFGDFMRFAAALTPGDGKTTPLFTKPETLGRLLTPSLFYGNGESRSANGFWSYDFASTVYGHGGNTAAFSAYLLIQPDSHTALTIMTNQANESIYNSDLPKRLFGEARHESQAEMPDASALRGMYRSTRIPAQGLSKLYGVVMTMPLLGGDENALSTTAFGLPLIRLNQSAADVYTLDDRSMIQLVDVLHAEHMAGGGAQLSMPYFGFIRIPTAKVLWEFAALLLLAIALLYFAAAILFGAGRRAILRARHRIPETSTLRKWHLCICALGLIEGANIVWMVQNLMMYQPRAMFYVNIGITWVYAAAAMAYLGLLLLRAHKLTCNRREKAMYVMSGLLSLGMVVNIVVWEWYRL